MTVPTGLAAGGRVLWEKVTEAHDLTAVQLVQLEEACRAKDRLDKLDRLLSGDVKAWVRITRWAQGDGFDVVVDDALGKANSTATLMKQLLAALRLPDETGKRPPLRGQPRGVYAGKLSSLERARRSKTG